MSPSSAPSQSNPSEDASSVTSQQRTQFFIFLLIGMCLVFAASYTGRVLAKIRVDNAVLVQASRNVTAQDRMLELEDRLAYVQSDAYAEEKARGEFGMAQPGDKKVVILPQPGEEGVPMAPSSVANPPQPAPTLLRPDSALAPTRGPDPDLPIWRQWLALFRAVP